MALLAGHRQDFFVSRTGNASLHGVVPCLSPQTMQIASMLLGLVSTQAPLISLSTRSEKLPFFQKAMVVVMIINLVRIKDCEELRAGAYMYARDKLNIRANAPSFCLKVVCKRGGIFSGV